MFLSWPPARLLSAVAIVTLLLVGATFLVATHQPWLGIKFAPDTQGEGIIVEAIHPQSTSSGLKTGDVVTGILVGPRFQKLDSAFLLDDPTMLPTYAEHNQLRQRHDVVWSMLNSGSAELVLSDGKRVTVHLASIRPASDLPGTFWFLVSNGVLSVIIAVAIWVFRRESGVSGVLLCSAVAFLGATLAVAILLTRELTLSPFLFSLCVRTNVLGSMTVLFSVIVLLWYYPVPFRRFPVAPITYGAVALFWVNETLQLLEFPWQTFFVPTALAFIVIMLLAAFKWRFTRHEAISRATFLWFLMTMVVGVGFSGVFFYLPVLITGAAMMPFAIVYVVPTFVFIGLAFGIARYRLFDLERWWLEVWLWLVGGFVVVALDFALIALSGLSNVQAFGAAIIVAGWAYLPARQWLFRRMLKTSQTRLENHLPALVETLFREASVISFADRWKELLQRVFAPMTTAAIGTPLLQSAVTESGAALRVPSLDGSGVIELRHRDQGSQLYHPRDAALADTMLTLTRRTAGLWDAKEEGARTERTRIMRDLHDDVAARLLTLVHGVSDPAQQTQVREAIGSLRHVIYALDDHKLITLADFLDELQAHLRERLRHTNTVLDWHEPTQLPVTTLSPRERINLTRAVQEATSNCLRHAQPMRLTVTTATEGGQLRLHICNDGNILRMEDWSLGKGVHNIKTRMNELGGLAEWSVQPEKQSDQKLCCLTLSVPLANLSSP